MDEDPTVPQEATTELQPDPEAPAIEGEPVDGEAQPVTRRRRGTRGGRGRGRSGGVAGAGPGGALIEKPRDTIRPVTPPAERRGVSPREPRGITPRAVPPARGRGRELPTGSVESLIARQNVLFEDFANRQSETMRDVQRALRGVSGRDSLPGAGHATLALPKVALFLDVPNLIYAADDRNIHIDFGKLLDYLTEGRQLVRATAYAPITDDPMTKFEKQRFVEPVIGHGYKIVTKSWKRFADGSMKANFDIELAVDILTMSDRLDIVVLLSGDGDFRRVCELVESKGVRVEVVAFAQSTAMELRSVADSYIDLNTILDIVGA